MPAHHFSDQESMTIDENDDILDSGSDGGDSNASVSDQFGVFTGNGMHRLPVGSPELEIVKNSFISGMGFGGRDTNIVAIHKNMASFDLTRKARFDASKIVGLAVARKCGGNPNVKYAWYGGSKDELCEIVLHGFSGCKEPPAAANGQSYGGVGVHLIPAKFSCDGAMSSDVDESGLKHMLLCRVILGKMEMVPRGSTQSCPSSNEFDTGVDNFICPRRYIVWSAFMNSHIFPCFLVSFKAPNNLHAVPGMRPIVDGLQPIAPAFKVKQLVQNALRSTQQQNASRPESQWMGFTTLISDLSKFLTRPKVEMLIKTHSELRMNKITRPQSIQRIRQIAGDQLLIAVLRDCKRKMMDISATTKPKNV